MVTGKNACYTGCDLNNGMATLRGEGEGVVGRGGMIGLPGDQRVQQGTTVASYQHQQVSQTQQHPMAVVIRGANSQNTVQVNYSELKFSRHLPSLPS